jgi:hypothetical protein
MIDNEAGVVRQNLEKAIRDQVDVRFEYHSTALDRWCEFLSPLTRNWGRAMPMAANHF